MASANLAALFDAEELDGWGCLGATKNMFGVSKEAFVLEARRVAVDGVVIARVVGIVGDMVV